MVNGTAYGFFHSDSSEQLIQQELEDILQTPELAFPSNLELKLSPLHNFNPNDSNLFPFVKEAQTAGLNYLVQGTYPLASNQHTADELATLLNQAYQSEWLSQQPPPVILYKENDTYHFRE